MIDREHDAYAKGRRQGFAAGKRAALKKQNHWISVMDELPNESGRYLCWFGKNKLAVGVDVATYSSDKKAFWSVEWNEPIVNVTHWMPIPKGPKEGE